MLEKIVDFYDSFILWIASFSIARQKARLAHKTKVARFNCELSGCLEHARYGVQWGANELQKGNFCELHVKELWDKLQPQIQAGLCFWNQSSPRKES